jgi:hypothetical protein
MSDRWRLAGICGERAIAVSDKLETAKMPAGDQRSPGDAA